MSWEEMYRRKYPCPCKNGEYEVIGYSDDWGQSSSSYLMLCPICKEKYVYDKKHVSGHPGNFRERGWVLKDQQM